MQHTLQPFDAVKCTPEQRKTILVLGRKIGMEIYKDGFWDTDQWPFIIVDQNTLHGCSSAHSGANWLPFDEFVSRMKTTMGRDEAPFVLDKENTTFAAILAAIMPFDEQWDELRALLNSRARSARRFLFHSSDPDLQSKYAEQIGEINEQIKLFLAIP